MNRTYRGGSVTPDPSLFTAVMEGQWEIVREKVSPSTTHRPLARGNLFLEPTVPPPPRRR
jgi:hypothetical protein